MNRCKYAMYLSNSWFLTFQSSHVYVNFPFSIFVKMRFAEDIFLNVLAQREFTV